MFEHILLLKLLTLLLLDLFIKQVLLSQVSGFTFQKKLLL